MQGVTIVCSEEIMRNPYWMIIFTIILFIAVFVFWVIGVATDNDRMFVFICACGICGIGMIIVLSLHTPNIHDYTKYYITVSDETPMLEFNEKYEVLERHGDLWEVKEIQEDN